MRAFRIICTRTRTRKGYCSLPCWLDLLLGAAGVLQVGVLQMINKVGDAGFDKADEDMLRNFVGPAALVIAENPMYHLRHINIETVFAKLLK